MTKFSRAYSRLRSSCVVIAKQRDSTDSERHYLSDYCSFLLSLFEISMEQKFRFKFCNADETLGFTSSEMANFMGLLSGVIRDSVIEKEAIQR